MWNQDRSFGRATTPTNKRTASVREIGRVPRPSSAWAGILGVKSLLVNVLSRFQPLHQSVQIDFLSVRSCRDRQLDFLRSFVELALRRVDSCKPRMHKPLVRMLLR